jgi:hypothetical protein
MFGMQAAISGGLFNTIVDGLGKVTGVGAVALDLVNITSEYNKCMAGKE